MEALELIVMVVGFFVLVALSIGLILAFNIWDSVQSQKSEDRRIQMSFNNTIKEQVDTIRNIVNEQGRIQMSLDSSIRNMTNTITNLTSWLKQIHGEHDNLKQEVKILKNSAKVSAKKEKIESKN